MCKLSLDWNDKNLALSLRLDMLARSVLHFRNELTLFRISVHIMKPFKHLNSAIFKIFICQCENRKLTLFLCLFAASFE